MAFTIKKAVKPAVKPTVKPSVAQSVTPPAPTGKKPMPFKGKAKKGNMY